MRQERTLQPATTTQERLRQTALDLFCTQGYQSTSLRDLAAHLGVQAGSIYNHIENKQCLLFELMEEVLDELLVETRHSVKRGSTAQARLRLFVNAFVTFQSRERKRLSLIDRETINLTDEQRERIAVLRQEYAQCLRSVIHAEVNAAKLPADRIQVLVTAIIGMLQSVSLWNLNDTSPSPQELVDQLTNMITGAIAAAKR